ncbi:hypothetical protein SS50377_22821 [Spironucleus salmonicida]|uniref:Uncharacterized protein n=1 Tax=Spironucleus salmonicida TaxID=348837 RepID=A0A9P8RZJ4_9EUKA|nr:hypothetical protein SS50377_22809 [Spironucleus salmonicida]KAH0575194.1 hypothetical protein SS50377_22821 [Spironucleus salmonicida]
MGGVSSTEAVLISVMVLLMVFIASGAITFCCCCCKVQRDQRRTYHDYMDQVQQVLGMVKTQACRQETVEVAGQGVQPAWQVMGAGGDQLPRIPVVRDVDSPQLL